MNRTTEDSKKEFDIVCMSFGKEKEKGIEVVEAGEKDSFLNEIMEIKAGNCTALDMKFSKEQMAQLRKNREARKTAKALARLKTATQR